MTGITDWIDLASRALGGSVVFANDELFAEKENLIKPEPSAEVNTFGHKGGNYDGWETRRRREPGHDFAIVRLGVPGIVHGVVVDTAHFTGNYPASVSVQAAALEGYPSTSELTGENTEWVELVPRTECLGDTKNEFLVDDRHRYTHIRLNIFPDGGVARLRVHGEAVPDPRLMSGLPLDLAGMEYGGRVIDSSGGFFSSADRVLAPDRSRFMDGWETKRRRDSGNDWLELRLAGEGLLRQAEIDTSYNVGNAPGACRILAHNEGSSGEDWWELLPRTTLQPDTRHRFVIDPGGRAATHVRIDIYPDGGLARVRLFGDLTPAGRTACFLNWFNSLPNSHATAAWRASGLREAATGGLIEARPLGAAALEDELARLTSRYESEVAALRGRFLTN